MRVVFFGNHTVGLTALSTLTNITNVVGVIAHPVDPEDGINYESVYGWACDKGLRVIRGKPTDLSVIKFVVDLQPDLLWVTDYRYILPETLVNLAPHGAINLHPSLLPKYRGRASINWAILNGETEIGLTAHYIDLGTDSGDIIHQIKLKILETDYIGDVIKKLLPLYKSITRMTIKDLKINLLNRQKQNELFASYFTARYPKDGQIDWRQSAVKVVNLVRAVSTPYPGAYSYLGKVKVYIWKASMTLGDSKADAGTIVKFESSSPVISCGDNAITLNEFEFEGGKNSDIWLGQKFSWVDENE